MRRAAFLFLVASVAGKLVGVRIAGRILGWANGDASIIGWYNYIYGDNKAANAIVTVAVRLLR